MFSKYGILDSKTITSAQFKYFNLWDRKSINNKSYEASLSQRASNSEYESWNLSQGNVPLHIQEEEKLQNEIKVLDYYEDNPVKEKVFRESLDCQPNEGSPIKYIHDNQAKEK